MYRIASESVDGIGSGSDGREVNQCRQMVAREFGNAGFFIAVQHEVQEVFYLEIGEFCEKQGIIAHILCPLFMACG